MYKAAVENPEFGWDSFSFSIVQSSVVNLCPTIGY